MKSRQKNSRETGSRQKGSERDGPQRVATSNVPSRISHLSEADIVADYRLAFRSRQASLIGRREVLSGKAKFGIFGDGKEVAQVALAHAWRPGDFRSGYYRDQTLALALGVLTLHEFFAQLYAHADVSADPASGGRQMNAHLGTRFLGADGEWLSQSDRYNISSDVSPTGSQMPRLVGLGYASRLYRELEELASMSRFSDNGNEVAFGTIGNASCAEGLFWESINAIGVLQVPVVVAIWDDEYGISVPNQFQITKGNLSEVLAGFRPTGEESPGLEVYTVPGWNYPELVDVFQQAANAARRDHQPAIVHVTEMTQPQGHSTSGSHERYKSDERLEWEEQMDALLHMRRWIIEQGFVSEAELTEMENADRQEVEEIRQQAWDAYMAPIRSELDEAVRLIDDIARQSAQATQLADLTRKLRRRQVFGRRDIMKVIRQGLMLTRDEQIAGRQALIQWRKKQMGLSRERCSAFLYGERVRSALDVREVPAVYSQRSGTVRGFEILNNCFDQILARDPRTIVFGEDVGHLGGVNQTMAGLQAKYGPLRVSDTGIREATIVGQAIGMALRGLRPIAEIQYVDYLLYALQIMSDDLATLHWRTFGGQIAPVIVRTRGHRLEGVWHAGSPMASIIHLVRGMHVCVPRDMTQAAGMYNTLLQADEPALLIEVLNGYRLKERMPDNLGAFTVPLGMPEVLRSGDDITIVTYGANCRIVMEAADLLAETGVDAEVMDVQTLLPFDRHGRILDSLKKTNRILFVDEDVPGGGTAYMMQEILEKWGGYHWLDSEPRTLTAQPHRPAYGSDGDYWSKPNVEQVFEAVYELMNEADPASYPIFYR